MKVRFIINPIAGGSDKVEEVTETVSRLLRYIDGIFEIRATRGKGDGRRLSEEARRLGYDCVYVCGGDGTINEVASPLVNTDMLLGIIPGGSGNGLARGLGLGDDLEAQIGLLTGTPESIDARVRSIDVGTIGGRYFFATAGLGFDALLSKAYAERKGVSKRRGIFPYIPAAFREFRRFKPKGVFIQAGEKRMRYVPFILTIANTSQYGADAVIAKGAKPDDGILDMCIVPEVGLIDAIKVARSLFNGTIDEMKGYIRYRSDYFEVHRDEPGTVHVDGEHFTGEKKLKISLIPGGLKVLMA